MFVDHVHQVDGTLPDSKAGEMREEVITNEETHENEVVNDSFKVESE